MHFVGAIGSKFPAKDFDAPPFTTMHNDPDLCIPYKELVSFGYIQTGQQTTPTGIAKIRTPRIVLHRLGLDMQVLNHYPVHGSRIWRATRLT